ncbi:MAG: extracellular solute-binding protein, partial [Clostridia bacterium]|nr:extracellular solute-binding protein [Clostridia bacterium]
QVIDNFKSGLTAMTIHHIGSSAQMMELFGDDVDAFIFPKGEGQWTSMGDTETVMFNSCANKEAAFEWMAYLATGKGQETWCTVTGNVPVAARVQALEQFQSNPFMKVSIEGSPVAGILPVLDTTTEWISNWPSVIQQALLGQITAEEAMHTLQAAMWAE